LLSAYVPYAHQIQRLSTIPGIKRRLAEVILAEIGPDMSRFPDARHLASWAGMCPGNNESGGKRLSGKTRKGSPWLRSALVEAAHAAIHAKDSYLSAQYQRLVVRREGKKATIAVGHTLLVVIYHILSEDEDYEELGGNYFDEWDRQAVQKRLVRRLEKLGYEVKLEPTSPAASLKPGNNVSTKSADDVCVSRLQVFLCSAYLFLEIPFFKGVPKVGMSRLILGFTG
jgi:hypothetical protein